MNTHISSPVSHSSAPRKATPFTGPRLPEWARILLTMLAMLAAYVPIMLISSIPAFSEWLKSSNYLVNTVANLCVQLSVGLMMLLLATVLIRALDRRPVAALGLSINLRAFFSFLLGTALAIGIIWGSAFALYAFDLVSVMPHASAAPSDAPVALVLALILGRAFFLQGFGEEVLFRGYLMQSLSARPQRALWISVGTFTILHLLSQGPQQSLLDRVLYLILPLGFAVLAGYLAILLRSTWAAVGIHGGMHVGTMMLTYWMQLDTNTMLSVVINGLIFLAAGLIVARFIPRSRWDEVAAIGPYAA